MIWEVLVNDWVRSIDSHEYDDYFEKGLSLEEDVPQLSEEDFTRYEGTDRYLDAGVIEDELFPGVDADIFLSHSHEDSEAVTAFAGYLCTLGRKPFVDSFVWENVYKLLKNINERYSRGSTGKMDYQSVVKTSANIYMILNTALIKMMDKADDYIFLKSPDSFSNGNTFSPWIYSEILYSQILGAQKHLNEETVIAHSKFIYPTYIKHLIPLEPNKITQMFAKQRIYYVK